MKQLRGTAVGANFAPLYTILFMTGLEERILEKAIQKIFLGGGSTKKCDHDCDQALIKSS